MLRIFKEAGCFNEFKDAEAFSAVDCDEGSLGTVFTLQELTVDDVSLVYKYADEAYSKLALTTDYAVADGKVTLVLGLFTGERLIILPVDRLELLFGGAPGETVALQKPMWLKRDSEYVYGSIMVTSEDLSADYETPIEADGVTFTADEDGSYSSASFVDLPSCTGRLVAVDRQYVGSVIGNDNDSLTLDTDDFGLAEPGGTAEILKRGDYDFALADVDGNAGAFSPAINVAPIDNDTPVKIFVRCSRELPESATNLPNMAVRIRAIEFAA